MRIPLISLLALFGAGCSVLKNPTQDSYAATQARTARLQETAYHYRFTLVRLEDDTESVISFRSPKKQVIETEDITDYTQNTTTGGQPSWSGGGFAGGFLFVKRKDSAPYVDVHALELQSCSCRHIIPFFANGRYMIKQDGEQGGTGQPATRPVDEPEGGDKPQPEAEGRSR